MTSLTSAGAEPERQASVGSEYQLLASELQSLHDEWADAPKGKRNEAMKVWFEANQAKLAVLRKNHPLDNTWVLLNPYSLPIHEGTPPARRAYLEARRDLWELEHVSPDPQNKATAETKLKLEEQRLKAKKMEEAAKAETAELEKKRLESERKMREKSLTAIEEDRVARRAFFDSLKELSSEERQAAVKKWNSEYKPLERQQPASSR